MTDLPDGWTLWNDEHEGRRILAYRPDVFNESSFPAECMPTIFVWNGSRAKRPGATQIRTETWHAVLYLEPEIEAVVEEFDSREAAVEGAEDIAQRFADGEIDYRGVYQIPREDYFDKLDELTGREP
ncbi:hypothetical protein E6P09_12580 [Haloferax mediterranei ATCC 33500]|uniref:Uncharacterized protein n=1 Tax=Haloferax mediterranei (strain ATCC 33500 / DSM 1411 / JCM 8866 / NBRC 14739 / NCIMB 2177 / R-4) TaxID=523841 RepID=I3R8F0_HALMT|nr:DUF5820 family protein [Haloferax mediterranei]AFK20510.1 hypothetical protein HFX_2839 [Haloferax mediterranei ATCC 33500]AHZ23869.1 hypothetical protein BM92_14995 [Haloferax mediterranei ATCC 33500]ELZ98293.1 hypothetical protein C439_15950 [Haloferax mediterranei ATCC 33500]MDX5986734.1 DUF5820 family protein [Haloferax mediterranei ATCC 33500]QCQ76058.1 hypothetical protein E6P09_12580 [Haloferax mediterranei ATCC 33500]